MKHNYTNISIKKNDLDLLFQNLSENPVQLPNKDFRLQLSTIYQLFEEEFSGSFFCRGLNPLRKTNFYILPAKKLKFFITPITNFDFYLKSKGSLYRLQSVFKEIDGKTVEGYEVDAGVVWEYFDGFSEILNFDDGTESFNYLNYFTQVIMKIVERLYFIPTVKVFENTFSIVWELMSDKQEIRDVIEKLSNTFSESFFISEQKISSKELFNRLLDQYFNYIIYKFLFIKAGKFKEAKSAHYFIKNIAHKRYERGTDLAFAISEWLDEIQIGKYNIVPLIRIEKLDEDRYKFIFEIQNKTTKEILPLSALNNEETIFGINTAIVIRDIEKQINYITLQK